MSFLDFQSALDTRYEIERKISDGYPAAVFLARDLADDRRVAIKILVPELADSLNADQFVQGTQGAAVVTHSNLLSLCDSGEADAHLFYAAPYVEGVTARDKLDAHGRAPIAETIRILRVLVDVLVVAHQRGVFHLNLQPEHVVLSGRQVLLADLGVAQAIHAATKPGQRMHLRRLIDAPETTAKPRGGALSLLNQRVDVYRIGALAYELLTGQSPPSPPSRSQTRADAISDQRGDTPGTLASIVMKCLEPDPAARWQSVEELIPHLELAARDYGTSSLRPSDVFDSIGRYRIIHVLGKGGMGVVYLAEQTKPVKRRVALKVIKLGMDTQEVLARFEAERQALAVMDHPNIAQIYDAGATPSGRPFFVMELVAGEPLTEYCDRQRLTVRERLELFIPTCKAVQHAHQKGIIHRDLKPSNVLVTVKDDQPVPKVIDFGLVKAIGRHLTDQSLVTEHGQLIGTPEYMSPEQAEMSGIDVDARTDVYTLGVTLYELLTGTLPFESRAIQANASQLRRSLRETDAPKPSARFDAQGSDRWTVAELHGTDPTSLHRQLKGDLDLIVTKAMDKERTRRYQTPLELARDLQRHVNHEPIEARAPSATYRFGKLVRRHKVGVTTGLTAAVGLIFGLVATTTLWLRATRAEHEAEIEAETASDVSDFLVGLFNVADPSESHGNTITAREILDRGAESIASGLKEQPQVQARLMATLARVYDGLGLYGEASPMVEQTVRLLEADPQTDPVDLAQAYILLGTVDLHQAKYGAADSLFRLALDVAEQSVGTEHPSVAIALNDLAALYNMQGFHARAVPLLQRALAIDEKQLAGDQLDLAPALNNLGSTYANLGQYTDALPLLERAHAIRERVLGPEHPDLARSLGNLAALHSRQGNFALAESLDQRVLAIQEKSLGPDHPDVAFTISNLAAVNAMQGKFADAEPYVRRALTIAEKALGPEHPDVAWNLQGLGRVLTELGQYEEAQTTLRRALAIGEKALGSEHPEVASTVLNLASLEARQRRYEDAERSFKRAVSIWEGAFGPEHPQVAAALNGLAVFYADRARFVEAESLYRRALTIREEALGPQHLDVAETLDDYARLLRKTDRMEQADTLLARALAIRNSYINE